MKKNLTGTEFEIGPTRNYVWALWAKNYNSVGSFFSRSSIDRLEVGRRILV